MSTHLKLAGILLAVLVSATAHAEKALSPNELIKSMSATLQSMNYEGSFVHSQNGHLEAMKVLHSSDHEGEHERMISLTGEAREIYRNSSLVTCIWPGTDAVIVSDSKNREIIPRVDASLADNIAYSLELQGSDRVAGRDTHVIDIRPKDQDRYGYRFWVDTQTHMLLRSSLYDQDGNAIEQMMFTDISFPDEIALSRFDLPLNVQEVAIRQEKQFKKPVLEKQRVDFSSLPTGYTVVSESYQPMQIDDAPVSHLLLSDGMASISVYVEYKASSESEGAASMGGMNAYTHGIDSALVTVVGEVPARTVESIAKAVFLVE